jgi:hypothetical protein
MSCNKSLASSVGNQKGSFIPIFSMSKDSRLIDDDDNDSDE